MNELGHNVIHRADIEKIRNCFIESGAEPNLMPRRFAEESHLKAHCIQADRPMPILVSEFVRLISSPPSAGKDENYMFGIPTYIVHIETRTSFVCLSRPSFTFSVTRVQGTRYTACSR